MDVGRVLRAARVRAGISQAELARRAGVDRSQLNRYEQAHASPTVATLDRLLAACDLQLSGALEPYLADVDATLDDLLAGDVQLDTAELPNLVLTLEDDPAARHHPLFPPPHREGPLTWAFDGPTALQLQGLPFPTKATCIAVVLDDAARWWLKALMAPIAQKGVLVDPIEASRQVVEESLRRPFWSTVAYLLVRPVDRLPATVRLAVDWADRPVPVATVDAVEQSHSSLAELLARLRQRRRAER